MVRNTITFISRSDDIRNAFAGFDDTLIEQKTVREALKKEIQVSHGLAFVSKIRS